MSSADGTQLWQTEIEAPHTSSSIQGMAADGDTIFVAGPTNSFDEGSNRLAAYPVEGCGAATCAPEWTAPVGRHIGNAGPVVGGGVAYVDADGIRAYPADGCGAATCDELHHVPLPGMPRAFSLSGGRLFVAYTSGTPTFPALAAYAP